MGVGPGEEGKALTGSSFSSHSSQIWIPQNWTASSLGLKLPLGRWQHPQPCPCFPRPWAASQPQQHQRHPPRCSRGSA